MYGNVARILEGRGHNTLFAHSGSEATLGLLRGLGLRHVRLPQPAGSPFRRILDALAKAGRLTSIAREFGADFMVDGIPSALSSRALGIPHLLFLDGILSRIAYLVVAPLTSYFIHSTHYGGPRPAGKSVAVDSCREMAYLHPSRFRPSEEVLEYLGEEPYALFWRKSSPRGGFTPKEAAEISRSLAELGLRVYTGSEESPPAGAPRFSRPLPIPLELVHSALYFARLVVTDEQDIAAEAAFLGTPVVLYDAGGGGRRRVVLDELVRQGLLAIARTPEEALRSSLRLVAEGKDNRRRARKYASGKLDLAGFLADLIEAGGGG